MLDRLNRVIVVRPLGALADGLEKMFLRGSDHAGALLNYLLEKRIALDTNL